METTRRRRSETDDKSNLAKTNLPSAIVEDILTRLPVKPLLQFRCVNKQWRNLLTTDLIFVQKHFTKTIENDENYGLIIKSQKDYYFIPDGVFENAVKLDSSYIKTSDMCYIVGSSNGLICLSHESHLNHSSTISIWNPATREYKILPNPQIQPSNSGDATIALGFCFHPGINDYKVVRLVHLDEPDKLTFGTEFEVYSLTTDSWTRVGVFPYYVSGDISRAILNGVVHWRGRHGNSFQISSHTETIISFDMDGETIKEVPMLDSICSNEINSLYLRTFGECLSVFVVIGEEELNIWVMKEYGVKESWTKLFTVELHQTYIPYKFEFLRNGELLLGMHDSTFRSYLIVSYNLESKSFKEISIDGVGKGCHVEAVPYVKTLVPLMGAHNQVQGQKANEPYMKDLVPRLMGAHDHVKGREADVPYEESFYPLMGVHDHIKGQEANVPYVKNLVPLMGAHNHVTGREPIGLSTWEEPIFEERLISTIFSESEGFSTWEETIFEENLISTMFGGNEARKLGGLMLAWKEHIKLIVKGKLWDCGKK